MVPEALARTAQEQRQAAVILRKADIGLALKLAVDVKLQEVGPAHSRHMIPDPGAQGGGGVKLGFLAHSRTDQETKHVHAASPGFTQIKAFEAGRASVLL